VVVLSDAVRLFVERVRTLDAEYEVGPADRAGVIELCRRLDGVPLAIELAAARASAMSAAEIASLLDERFRLLTGGRRGGVERHQTLRATVDWSYSLLDARDRNVFARLGVFPAASPPTAPPSWPRPTGSSASTCSTRWRASSTSRCSSSSAGTTT
jgi:predicted ATPase